MKKLMIAIVIIILGGIGIVGGYSMKQRKLSNINNVSNNSINQQNSNNINSATNNSNSTDNSNRTNIKELSAHSTLNQNANNKISVSGMKQINNSNDISSSNNDIKPLKTNNSNNNQISNTSNTSNENNSNSINISDYIGVWNPVMEAQWNEDYNKNIIPTKKQLDNNKLIMTAKEFSYNGLTINNPVYKIVPIEFCQVFGNAHMGDYGSVNNNFPYADNSEIGIPKTPYSLLYFIVALPKGNSLIYPNGGLIFKYPYILNGRVFALLNAPEQPLYKFNK